MNSELTYASILLSYAMQKSKKTRSKKIASRKSDYLEFKNVDRAVEVALYYGFTPLPLPLTITKEDREKARSLGEEESKIKDADCMPLQRLEEKIPLIRYCLEKKICDSAQPVFIASEISQTPARKSTAEKRLFLDIIGSSKSIAEAIIIQTIIAMFSEEGYKELSVHINSIGDKESSGHFMRELINYYRKNIVSLPTNCRATLRRNPVELLECQHEKCRLLGQEAPKSISFLSESSRAHFKEVLEYLEELKIPYQIDNQFIGSRAFATDTIFSIRDTRESNKDPRVATGFRYNNLGKRMGAKRDIPSVGAMIRLPRGHTERKNARLRIKRPEFFFLQLGFEAKQKSLAVVETLRQAGILLYHAIARDKLVSQLSASENLRIPYFIIMGQREALENSVIVRNTTTRAQETIKIGELVAYLKNIKKKK